MATASTFGSQRFGLKEVCDITIISLATNNPVIFMDTLKMSDIENKASTVYAQGGRGNPRLIGWDFDRQSTLKMQDALMSLSSLSLLAGNSLVDGAHNIFKREVLVVAASATTGDNMVTLTETPVANSITLFASNDGGETLATQISDFTVNGTSPKEMDFPTADAAVGASVVAFYQYNSTNTTSLKITSDAFPGYYKVIGDTVVRDETTGTDEPVQIVIPKAKLNADFTLSLKPDGNPTVLDFTLEIFKSPNSTEMIEIVRY